MAAKYATSQGPSLDSELLSSRAIRRAAMATHTGYTLDQFLADTRATIKTKGVPSGLAEIREHLEKLLRNPELLNKHLGDPVPYRERTTIGHDPETDVHVQCTGARRVASPCPTITAHAG